MRCRQYPSLVEEYTSANVFPFVIIPELIALEDLEQKSIIEQTSWLITRTIGLTSAACERVETLPFAHGSDLNTEQMPSAACVGPEEPRLRTREGQIRTKSRLSYRRIWPMITGSVQGMTAADFGRKSINDDRGRVSFTFYPKEAYLNRDNGISVLNFFPSNHVCLPFEEAPRVPTAFFRCDR